MWMMMMIRTATTATFLHLLLTVSRASLLTTAQMLEEVSLENEATESFLRHLQMSNYPCNIECRNGGVCAYVTDNHDQVSALARSGILVQHCICPQGFGGVACEIPVERCLTVYPDPEVPLSVERPATNPRHGDVQYICEHSKKPCDRLPDDSYTCACHVADRVDARAAGRACRKWNTEYCTGSFQVSVSTPTPQVYFCTNGGKCQSDFLAAQIAPGDASVNAQFADAGCACNPNFYGPHCEYLAWTPRDNVLNDVGGFHLEQYTDGKDGNKGGSVRMLGWLVALAGVVGVALVLYHRRRRQRRGRAMGPGAVEGVFRDDNDSAQQELEFSDTYMDAVMDEVDLGDEERVVGEEEGEDQEDQVKNLAGDGDDVTNSQEAAVDVEDPKLLAPASTDHHFFT